MASSFSIEYFPPKVDDIVKMPSASVSITAASAAIVQLRDERDEEEIMGSLNM